MTLGVPSIRRCVLVVSDTMPKALGREGMQRQAARHFPARSRLKLAGFGRYKDAMLIRILSLCVLLGGVLHMPLSAQTRETPYWATIKTDELNMRVGPSREFPIDWVYKRKGLPIKVIRVTDGWRLIEDMDGTQGWVSQSLLSPRRSALVVGEGLLAMRDAPASNAKLKWNLQAGVVGYLGNCEAGWCEMDVRGHTGWVDQSRLWGAGEP